MIEQKSATIHLVQTSRFAKRLAVWLLYGLFLSIIGMAFLPWQQTSRGTGQVVAYAPQERQQQVQAPIKGVVERLAPGLVEGSVVKQGDFILEVQPFAPELRQQIEAQVRDLENQEKNAIAEAEAYGNNVTGFTEAGEFTVEAAKELVRSAEAKLRSKERLMAGYRAKELQARLNYQRQEDLEEAGVQATKEVEKLRKEWDVALADIDSLKEEIESLKLEVKAKQAELEEKKRIAQTKIDYAVAMQQKALGSVAKIRKEQREVQAKLGELQRTIITAPRDGTIFRMPIFERGQAIKEGDPLFTLIPEASQKAVELFINGNDMPLIQIGQEVRLQFEGWPAVQFVGWPSVAVGTFSGTVVVVDATDNGKGQFRILVAPREGKQAWPSDRYLRQGVRVNGWVMLRQVSLGYEIWRQLNGFPVIVSDSEPKSGTPKTPKLPKT